ncbi:hypothetical protein AAK967_00200 [Atopobiaceae bacterium 24-176]
MWECCLFDTMTGLVGQPVDVPALTWSVSVSDCSLSTARDKGVGADDVGTVDLPWSAVPGHPSAAHGALAPLRRGLCLVRDGAAVAAGAIGPRTDTWDGTSFAVMSPMALLSQRLAVAPNTFGRGTTTVEEGEDKGKRVDHVTTSQLRWTGQSLRSIACRLIEAAVSGEGASLPIDYGRYLGERGGHERTYDGFNAANNDVAKLLDALTNVSGGPDIQLRPYLVSDPWPGVRWDVVAGSDAVPGLPGADTVPTLTCFPGGGTAQGLECASLAPVMRVYGTGSGQDKATLCHEAADLSLCRRADPWPLLEATVSNSSDWDSYGLVRAHTESRLAAAKRPLVQLRCTVDASDPRNPVVPGSVWPGQRVDLDLEGHPTLPDGRYEMRLMEMSGDLGETVTLVFDQMEDPREV